MNKKKKNVIQLIKNVYNKLCVIKTLLNVYINNVINKIKIVKLFNYSNKIIKQIKL